MIILDSEKSIASFLIIEHNLKMISENVENVFPL